jgi:hypothetical protein
MYLKISATIMILGSVLTGNVHRCIVDLWVWLGNGRSGYLMGE